VSIWFPGRSKSDQTPERLATSRDAMPMTSVYFAFVFALRSLALGTHPNSPVSLLLQQSRALGLHAPALFNAVVLVLMCPISHTCLSPLRALSLSVPTPILPFLFFCSSPVLWASTLPHFSTLSFSCSCALYPTHASRRCALCHFQYDSLHHSPFLSYVSSNTLPTCIPNPFSNSQLFFEGVQQQKKSPFLRESSAKKTCQTPLEIISPTRS